MTSGSHLNRVRWGSQAKARERMVGVESPNRDKDDFYPTPPEATQGLLAVEQFCGDIWEPACGDGSMSRVLECAGHRVISSDLVDRGYGDAGHDFLMEWQSRAPNIVTNPPFKLASAFVRKALTLTTGKVAMLVKLAFAEGAERADVLDDRRLARVWVFRRRISFQRGSERARIHGNGMMAFAWYVWDHDHDGRGPVMGWIK